MRHSQKSMGLGVENAGGRRYGTATVELAVTLPFVLVLLLGLWEVGCMVDSELQLQTAAREGARQASTGTKTTAQVTQDVKTYLSQAGMTTTNVTVTIVNLTNPASSDPSSFSQMDHFQLVVSVPFADVSWAPVGQITSQTTLQASVDWYSMADLPVNVSLSIPTN